MSNVLDINGAQQDYNYFKSSTGYKCCTTVEHNINLYNNSNEHDSIIDIPVVDCNCHMLVMHLYNNDNPISLCNVSKINIKFICGNKKIVLGDCRKLKIVNSCKGTISYILDSDITCNLGENDIVVELTIGNDTITFNGKYNVVPNIQSPTSTVVLPDTERDSEYVYGPHCREVLTPVTVRDNECNKDCDKDSCPYHPDHIDEDEINADNVTLRDLYFLFMSHIKNDNRHITSADRDILDNIDNYISGDHEIYTGTYNVVSSTKTQVLDTDDRIMLDDVTVEELPINRVTNESTGTTIIIGGK